MKCPACDAALTKRNLGKVVLDVCDKGCAGIWFDNFELGKVDEKHEGKGEALLGLKPRLEAPKRDRRFCPKCVNVVLQRHYTSPKRVVEVDECPQCAGVWLDTGELTAIQKEFPTDQEREKAASGYFNKLFSNDLVKDLTDGIEQTKRKQKLANAFRLICPSYWIPGKQGGGAF